MSTLGTLFSDIADAIRSKTGGTDTMKPAEFPDAIAEIETGAADGSGGGFSLFYGSFTPSARTGPYTVTHNWGIVPDLIFLIGMTNGNTTNNDIVAAFGVSEKFKEMFPAVTSTQHIARTQGGILTSSYYLENGSSVSGHITDVTENSFQVGSSGVNVFTATYQYVLVAIQ